MDAHNITDVIIQTENLHDENSEETIEMGGTIVINDIAIDTSCCDCDKRCCWIIGFMRWLNQRLNENQMSDDMALAVNIIKSCVAATPKDHNHWAYHRMVLARLLEGKCKQSPNSDTINRAIDDLLYIADFTAIIDEFEVEILSILRRMLRHRLENFKKTDDIALIVKITDLFARNLSVDDIKRPCGFDQLAKELLQYFEYTRDYTKLDLAIEAMERCVEFTPSTHDHIIKHQILLAERIHRRFTETGQLIDLDRATDIVDKILSEIPLDSPDRHKWLFQLGDRLSTRFARTGHMQDLDRAIEVIIESINTSPPDDPEGSGPLNCLAIALARRCELKGSTNDLDQALNYATRAVELSMETPRYSENSQTLANIWHAQFERTKDPVHLNQAIKAAKAAMISNDENPCLLLGIAELLGLRHAINLANSADSTDLQQAIDFATKGVAVTQQRHPHLSIHLHRLSNLLYNQFKEDDNGDTLDAAIDAAKKAVDAMPEIDYYSAELSNHLGVLLKKKYDCQKSRNDFCQALAVLKKGLNSPNAPPSIRIKLARNAAELLAAEGNWLDSSILLEEAVKLLQVVSPRSLDHSDKQHMLEDFAGLASLTAAVVLNAGNSVYDALKLLELGRNMISGLILEMRTDISVLEEQDEQLSKQFISLRDELDSPMRTELEGDLFSWEAQAKRRRQADDEFKRIVAQIQSNPRFSGFLQPPTEQELMAGASKGPIIVVNANHYRCDAFLIEASQISLLPLPDLNLRDIEANVKKLQKGNYIASTLKWSWNLIAGPILETLGFTEPISNNEWPHIWWILTGPLSYLPIHASGHHGQGDDECVLDRVISSYNSSVKAIIYSRNRKQRKTNEAEFNNAVLISMSKTPGQSSLAFAQTEIETVQNLCSKLQLEPVIPLSNKQKVLETLSHCEIFHFAGHGESDLLQPAKSRLLLEDWETDPLTVGDVRDMNMQDAAPFLAYLSACSTGQTRAESLIDETIHLVSAFQLAGFRHVVGTLWEVSDSYCTDISTKFYTILSEKARSDFSVAEALHIAVREVRVSSTPIKSATAKEVLLSSNHSKIEGIGKEGESIPVDMKIDIIQEDTLTERYGTRRIQQSNNSIFRWAPYIHYGV